MFESPLAQYTIEYRGYDIEDEENVLEVVTELIGAVDDLSGEE